MEVHSELGCYFLAEIHPIPNKDFASLIDCSWSFVHTVLEATIVVVAKPDFESYSCCDRYWHSKDAWNDVYFHEFDGNELSYFPNSFESSADSKWSSRKDFCFSAYWPASLLLAKTIIQEDC